MTFFRLDRIFQHRCNILVHNPNSVRLSGPEPHRHPKLHIWTQPPLSNTTKMDAELTELKFTDASIQGSPIDKQPFLILCWLNDLHKVLRKHSHEVAHEANYQRLVAGELDQLVEHIERSKEPIASKSIRDRIGSVYKLIYPESSQSTSSLFESINKYVRALTSTKSTEVKQ